MPSPPEAAVPLRAAGVSPWQIFWSAEMLPGSTGLFLNIVTTSVEGVQFPFEMVQVKSLFPNARLVTVVVGELGFVIKVLPVVDHWPVPMVGVFALIVYVVTSSHTVASLPALAVVGGSQRVIVWVAVTGEQPPWALETVQVKVVGPEERFVTVEAGFAGSVITGVLPEVTVILSK